jgi:hypothetical protein
MAIVAHYVTKSGQLGGLLNRSTQKSETNCINDTSEELLIDFRELEGEHSGANMAEATWETLTRFGIENRVCHKSPYCLDVLNMFLAQIMAFMTDNASNNDTLIDGIVEHAKCEGILLNGDWIRLRCMPHTIHLAALKVSTLFLVILQCPNNLPAPRRYWGHIYY